MRVTLLLLLVLARSASAHVGPSKDDNNRYLKLTPQSDRVRLAYTVFFGDVPGARMRATIDADSDGTISEREAQAFGDKLGAEVIAAIDINIDKVQQTIVWEQIVVGMGTPSSRGGAFSVDLVANVCSGHGTTHVVILRDRFKLLNPGETELKIEDTHGIKIASAKIGTSPERDVKFVGPGGPLADDGATFTFEVTDQAAPPTSSCATGEEPPKRLPPLLVIACAAAIAFILALVVTLIRKRKS